MNNLIQNYEIILKELQNLDINFSLIKQIRKPKLGNLELISMNLTAEHLSLYSECQVLRVIKRPYLESLIERSVESFEQLKV